MVLLHKKLAIFDMDGLLIDSEGVYAEGWMKGVREKGYDVSPDFIAQFAGQSAADNTADLFKLIQDMDQVLEIRKIREDYFLEQVALGKIKPMPYAYDILHQFQQAGIQTALASSTHKERAMKILESNDLVKEFDFLVFGDQVEKLKPEPDIYQAVLDYFQLPASQAFAMEDSVSGATAAYRAGIDVALVTEMDLMIQAAKDLPLLGIYKDLEEFYHKNF